ncbi:MAG: immunoglobulin-like domain-containing protein [Candidatus Merdisoma sp.]
MQGDKRDTRGKDGREENIRKESLQEELLAEAFGACMEEQLSFIPPEREIARMHTFSDRFTAAMEELCRTNGKLKKREMTRREFVFGFNKIAACILLMLVVGGACVGGYLISEHGLPGAGADSSSAEVAESTEQAADMAMPEEETASGGSSVEQEAGSGEEDAGAAAEEAEFMGGTVFLAEEQKLPAGTEEIKTLVSSPVLDRDAETVKVTIGNLSENTVSYSTEMELQVYLEGAWYVVPKTGQSAGEQEEGQKAGQIELEAGMAQDEEIQLADYALDYEAEKYRIVTYVDGIPFGSEFWFETLEEGLEEVLESTLDEPEQ